MVRRQNSNLRSFVCHSVARDFERIRSDVLGLKIGGGVILRDDHATSLDVVQQLALQIGNSILGVKSANAEHNCIESGKIFRRHINWLEQFNVVADLLETLGNLIS